MSTLYEFKELNEILSNPVVDRTMCFVATKIFCSEKVKTIDMIIARNICKNYYLEEEVKKESLLRICVKYNL